VTHNPRKIRFAAEHSPKQKPISPLLVGLITILLCAALPILGTGVLGATWSSGIALAIILCTLLCFRQIIGSFRPILAYIFILVGVLLMGSNLIIPALLAALVGGVCFLAYLCILHVSPAILIIPVAGYLLAFAVLRTPLLPAVALFPLPAALMLYRAMGVKANRVSTICRVSLGIAFSALCASLIFFLLKWGIPTPFLLSNLVEQGREWLIDNTAQTMLVMSADLGLELHSADIYTLTRLTVGALFNLAPALFVLLCNAIAFAIQSLHFTLLYATNRESKVLSESLRSAMRFDMSTVSAVFFLISGILALFLSLDSDTQLPATIAENLMLILIPGMVMTAWIALRIFLMKKGPSCLGSLLYTLFLISFVYLTIPMLILTAFAGAIIVLVKAAKQSKIQKS